MSIHVALVVVLFIILLQEVRPLNPCGHDEIFWQTTNPANYSCLQCPTCPEGAEPSIICGSTVDYGTPLHCVPCGTGTYSDKFDTNPCRVCTICQKQRLKSCTRTSNTVCTKNCQAGYYEDFVFNCVQCPKCCKINPHVSGCERKECQAYHSCPSEQSTGASTNSDAVSTSPTPPLASTTDVVFTSPTPPSSLEEQRESSEPTATSKFHGSKSALQLRTNSAFPARNISLSSTERAEQSSRHPPSTRPWTKLKSQVLNSTKSTTRHFIENTNISLPYVAIISCLALLLSILLVCLMMAYRCRRKEDPGKSTETCNDEQGNTSSSDNEHVVLSERSASAKADETSVTLSNGDSSSTGSSMVTANKQLPAQTAPIAGNKTENTESRNTTPLTGIKRKMTLSVFADKEYSSYEKVCELLDLKIPGCGNYEHVARHYGVDNCTIKSRFEKYKDGPSKALFEWLMADKPELTVGKVIEVLGSKRIKRNDVVAIFLSGKSEK